MSRKKKIFVIIGSAGKNSANEKLIDNFVNATRDFFSVTVFNGLKELPHFDPVLSTNAPPEIIVDLRNNIMNADGVVICTPEYIFSIPSGLKNALEWCVSTTVFSDKPTGLITASASGEKGHEELQLIMNTLMAKFNSDTTLLIQGIKGKIDHEGKITDSKANSDLKHFIRSFMDLCDTTTN